MEEKTLFEQLSRIPVECTRTTIQGVEMQIIDSVIKEQLLNKDPGDRRYHECILANGTFIFTVEDDKLSALYKVV